MMNVELKLAIGIDNDGKIMCGPLSAIEKHCSKYAKVVQGNIKSSDAAKMLMKKFNLPGILDDIIRALPAGGCKIEA